MDHERNAWATEAARSRPVYARQQALELVERARDIRWSCERECDLAQQLLKESAELRQARPRQG